MHNFPITVGSQTFLHTVCIAPIKDSCLLGLDFLTATGCKLDLAGNHLYIDGERVPVHIKKSPVLQISKVTVTKRTVIPPNTDGYLKVSLGEPMNCPYIFEPAPTDKALLSHVLGEPHVNAFTVEVVNDSNKFMNFKKGKSVRHAEPADSSPGTASPSSGTRASTANTNPSFCVFKTDTEEKGDQDHKNAEFQIPDHLKDMYRDSISELSDEQKFQFGQLLSEFPDVFSKDDFDLGCLTGVEHKIILHDEIPICEKFRRTPLHFQEQEKAYIEKLLQQGVLELQHQNGLQPLYW